MNLTILTGATALLFLGFIFELVRRRRLREKYAVLWIFVGVIVLGLGLFPTALNRVAISVGVANGVSLVLFFGVMFLLLVCLHLSWEASRLEDETRVLAEEVALLRLRMDERAELGGSGGRGGRCELSEHRERTEERSAP